MYESDGDHYKVDTLLLSCRVLGRGVEHALVSWLGKRAVKEGKRFVEFPFVPTGKNLPALEFITSIGDRYRNESGTSWNFPAERLASVAYDPDEKAAPIEVEGASTPDAEKPRPRPALGTADWVGRLQRIGENLFDVQRLVKEIEDYRIGKQPLPAATDVAPGSTLETALANIWKKVLGRPRIGMNDNFFDAGGTSLRAVQAIAMIKKELKQSLSIVSLFECPTVALLAARLSAAQKQADTGTAAAGAAQRGQQRRRKTMMWRAY
jgi:acyl carrier protein